MFKFVRRWITELVGRRSEDELEAIRLSRKRLHQRMWGHDGTRNSKPDATFTARDARLPIGAEWLGTELHGAGRVGDDAHGFGNGSAAVLRRLFSHEPGWNTRTWPWIP